MWERVIIDLGNIPEGSKHQIVFKYNEKGADKVRSIKTSCGCQKATIVRNGDIVEVQTSHTAGSIPYHLRGNQNFSEFSKYILANHESGKVTRLTYKGKIIKK